MLLPRGIHGGRRREEDEVHVTTSGAEAPPFPPSASGRQETNMARMKERSTPAAGRTTPWKGRLRSYHGTPQSVAPQRFPSRAENHEAAEEAQRSKKQDAPKIPQRGGARNEDAGSARPLGPPLRRSPRLAGRDPEYPIAIDGADKECKSRDDQSTITFLRRSPRFHKENKNSVTSLLPPNPQRISHNRTRNASRKDETGGNVRSHRNAAANTSSRIKMLKEPLSLGWTSQDNPLQQKNADLSGERSEEKELKANHCELLTKKRKRGTEGRSLSARTCYLKTRSMPPDCQEAAPNIDTRKLTCKKSGNGASFMVQPDSADMKLMNVKHNNQEPSKIEREGKEPFCGQDDNWTEEQDMALQQAYFTARPSPHFWKKVSKMVLGRSTEECINRILADLSTPTTIAPRPRRCKAKFSPLGNFSLADSELPNLLESTVRRQRTSKQKNLAAHKTARHLLEKHCLIDPAQVADQFSVFESSPSALQLNSSFDDSPGTPHSLSNPGSLCKSRANSSARKKPFSRLKSRQDEPSSAVLKPVKNATLHEKYMNRLLRRQGTKRPRRGATFSKAAGNVKAHSEQQAGDLKDAKNAVISEATSFISHFKTNSLANVVEDSEDDDTDGQ